MSTSAQTKWRLAGEEAASCNCAWGCPCQFDALPTHGRCEALAGWQIQEGYYGYTSLNGVKFARIFWWPGAIHEANGTRQLIIDQETTQEQREALIEIESGKQGGTFNEIFATVCPNVLDVLIAPISFESDRETRKAHVLVGTIGELTTGPIINPVTGEEHRARIVLPQGFEYKEAEVANTLAMHVSSATPLIFANQGSYGQLNAFDWSNS